jgi:hypothetical protein
MTNPPPAVRWIVTPDTSRWISTAEGIDIGPGTTASGACRHDCVDLALSAILLRSGVRSGREKLRQLSYEHKGSMVGGGVYASKSRSTRCCLPA